MSFNKSCTDTPDSRKFEVSSFILFCFIFLCFVGRASRYNRVKKNQLDSQLILSIFRQPLHVFGRIQAHHQEVQPYVYNNWYLLFFLGDSLLSWLDWNSNPARTTDTHLKRIISTNCSIYLVVAPDDGTTDSHLKGIISTNCSIHKVVPPDDGPRYAPKHVEVDEVL